MVPKKKHILIGLVVALAAVLAAGVGRLRVLRASAPPMPAEWHSIRVGMTFEEVQVVDANSWNLGEKGFFLVNRTFQHNGYPYYWSLILLYDEQGKVQSGDARTSNGDSGLMDQRGWQLDQSGWHQK